MNLHLESNELFTERPEENVPVGKQKQQLSSVFLSCQTIQKQSK
jgi:hypothetical protein